MKKLYRQIIDWFSENMPVAKSELDFASPYQLLIAVILSAQCTDKRVNLVTPALFERFPSPADLAEASTEEIYGYIKSVSYPNNKASHLKGMAQKLISDFKGIVPDDIDALQTLPGVGRKTANVVASIVYDKPVIAVDTHVFRVSHRLGLSKGSTPLAVEKDPHFEHTGRTQAEGAPLADTPRPICLHRHKTKVRSLRPRTLL